MNYFRKVPEELLLMLFSYLDKESKLVATEVCCSWRFIIHEICWKQISRLAKEDNVMKKDFSMLGWMENEHEFGECKCIDLHLGYFPFKNASWTLKSSNTEFESFASIDNEAVVLDQSKVIYAKSFNVEDEDEDRGMWVSNVSFYEFDLAEEPPLHKKVQQIRYEKDDLSHEEISPVLISYDNTLILQEIFYKYSKVKITLWNINSWLFVCEIPLQETVDGILKPKNGGVDEKISFNCKLHLQIEVNKDLLVVNVGVNDMEVSHVKSLAIFWKFDASNPAIPTFFTYILEETDHVDNLHLNAKYFCKRKDQLQVFALEDIKNNATSNSWVVEAFEPVAGFSVNESWLEGGNSKRLAVYESKGKVKVLNIESGECLFKLELDRLDHIMSDPEWFFSKFLPSSLKSFHFLLGNFIIIIPLRRYNDPSKHRYQIVIIDEMAENQVLLGASFDLNVLHPYDMYPRLFYIGSKTMVSRCQYFTYLWKLEN